MLNLSSTLVPTDSDIKYIFYHDIIYDYVILIYYVTHEIQNIFRFMIFWIGFISIKWAGWNIFRVTFSRDFSKNSYFWNLSLKKSLWTNSHLLKGWYRMTCCLLFDSYVHIFGELTFSVFSENCRPNTFLPWPKEGSKALINFANILCCSSYATKSAYFCFK